MEQQPIDKEVDRVIELMSNMKPESDEYFQTVQALKVLLEVRARKEAPRINPEIIFTVIGNLVGIVLILRHENLNVITSKAISFVRR